MNQSSSYDVIVIGAGPVGSTLAGLLKKYRPENRVLVLEKERFPRHKIGESLLVDVNRVLHDLGAFEQVASAGFSPKYGATFLWGSPRGNFTFQFSDGGAMVPDPTGFHLLHTWHVDRPRYDQILADQARSFGVEVREECQVLDVNWTEGRVSGVEYRDAEGNTHSVTSRFVVDAGGGKGPLTRLHGNRKVDDLLRNIAIWGYFKDLDWVEPLNGNEAHPRTCILTHPQGWVWCIPLANGITSVGTITSMKHYADAAPDQPEDFLWQSLHALPEFDALFSKAGLVAYRDGEKLIHSVQEWSYTCEHVHGPGWASVGDAAGFVDAILSIGCFVGQAHAQFLAYTLNSVLSGELDETFALDCYAQSFQENLAAFRSVAYMFYAYNTMDSDWWRECSAQLRRSEFVPTSGDRQSFFKFITGFSIRSSLWEESVNAFGGNFLFELGETLFQGEEVFRGTDLEREVGRLRQMVMGDSRLVFQGGFRVRDFALPHTGTGRLRMLKRIDIELPEHLREQVHSGDNVSKRLYLHEDVSYLIDLFDGSRTLSEIAAATLERSGTGDLKVWRAEVQKFAYRLVCMGALTPVGHGDLAASVR